MSWISTPIKIVACVSAFCGLTGYPYVYSSGQKIPQEKKIKSLSIGKFNNGGAGFSLKELENIASLIEGKTSSLNFQDLGMKWGDYDLKGEDILFSPCQNGNFYLMKSVGRGKYKLEGVEELQRTTPNCWREKHKYEHLPHINLRWVSRHSVGITTASKIFIRTCNLKKNTRAVVNNQLIITCQGDDLVYGGLGVEENNYEYD